MGSQYDLFNGPEKIIARFLSLTIPSLSDSAENLAVQGEDE